MKKDTEMCIKRGTLAQAVGSYRPTSSDSGLTAQQLRFYGVMENVSPRIYSLE